MQNIIVTLLINLDLISGCVYSHIGRSLAASKLILVCSRLFDNLKLAIIIVIGSADSALILESNTYYNLMM